MATLLTKTTTVLEKVEVSADGTACYEQRDEENMPRPIKSLFLPKDLVSQLGDPEQITLIITPGDQLNKE